MSEAHESFQNIRNYRQSLSVSISHSSSFIVQSYNVYDHYFLVRHCPVLQFLSTRIFLEGTMFTTSHSIDRREKVGRFKAQLFYHI